MKCKYCNTEMKIVKKWIAYPGPSEWIHRCLKCKASCVETEDGYKEWKKKRNEIKNIKLN